MKFLISLFTIILASLSVYFMTEYANNLQIHIYGFDEVPISYKMLFGISSIIGAIAPIVITMFLVFTIKIMLVDVFEKEISVKEVLQIVGISYIPMLLYYFFFWYSLISYCHVGNIRTESDFLNMKLMFDMQLTDYTIINYACWVLLYLLIVCGLIRNKVALKPSLAAALFPTGVVLTVYYLISCTA